MPLVIRNLKFRLSLAGGYLLLVVIAGVLLHNALTLSGELPPVFNRLQTGWQRELLLAQTVIEAQRSGHPDRRDSALAALRELQESQESQLRELLLLRSPGGEALFDRLDSLDSEFRLRIQSLTESREHAKILEELERILRDAEEVMQSSTQSLEAYTSAYGVFCWLWPIPLFAFLLCELAFFLRQRRKQHTLLGNYLAVPPGQLLEEAPARLPTSSGNSSDPVFETAFQELLRRIRQEARAREQFMAAMSHEVRTPMNGLLGFLSSLKETQLNDQQRQYLRIIDSSAKGLVHVISEILDFSKLRAGKLTASAVSFDLRSFVEERTALARQSARGKSLRVLLDFPGDGAVPLRSDPSLLRQVLDNLLGNAVKFTEHGEVVLEVALAPEPENSWKVDFAVRDSGIGMTQSEQEHLFKPYEQADSSIARRYGGTGLGLTISHAMVERLGGELKLTSRPGEGSCFYFTLHCAAAKPEELLHLSDLYHVKLPRTELKKHWALLVDDTLTNLFLLETICQSVGLPYRTAENGREALELCRKQHFDLIFMDIQMPIMDGYTAIREIRQLPDAATTAIIALTASAYQEDVEKALGAGSTGFIPKPFERDQLLLCIADALGIKAERELRESDSEMQESPEAAIVRRMYDFMREQYQLSLGEIKMLLAQTLTDWRPLLDNLGSYSQQGNTQETLALLHRLKGQLAAIGLLDYSEKTVAIMDAFREERRQDGQTMILALIQSLTRIFKLLENDVTLPEK